MTVTLASQSTARARMLKDAGVIFETHPARIDETAIKESLLAENAPARDIADTLAEMKARRVSGQVPGLVIGSDQVLTCNGRLYDKPETREKARDQLWSLRGETHELLSAAVIYENGSPVWRHIGAARLKMRPFSEAFLDGYLDAAGEDILSSVGAYHIEGLGAQLFARVTGDYFTILGMPLLELLGFLRMRGELTE